MYDESSGFIGPQLCGCCFYTSGAPVRRMHCAHCPGFYADRPKTWDRGEWGFCHWCQFDVPLTADGFLEPHSLGKNRPYAGCAVGGRTPDIRPHNGIILKIQSYDKIVTERVRIINGEDPRED